MKKITVLNQKSRTAKDKIEKLTKKNNAHPRSYRLDPEVVDTLKSTLDRINEVAPKKVSEARLIKALIIISKEIEDDRIIKALKEVW